MDSISSKNNPFTLNPCKLSFDAILKSCLILLNLSARFGNKHKQIEMLNPARRILLQALARFGNSLAVRRRNLAHLLSWL